MDSANLSLYSIKEGISTLNFLYKKRADTTLECLLNLQENDFMFNTILSLIVSGYFRNIFAKNKILPNEIKAFIIQYGKLFVLKYEINIYNGTLDKESLKTSVKSQFMTVYEENIYDKHIAFCKLNLGELFPKETPPGYISFNVEPFAIRIRAILNNERKCEYSEWNHFQTTSSFVCDVGIGDTYNWMDAFNDFWAKNNLKDDIDMNQFLLLFKKCGLNEFELKRIYYYMLNCGQKYGGVQTNNENITKIYVLMFAYIDVRRNYEHTYFVCDEWYNFRSIIQRFLWPNYVEFGRRVESKFN